jgi:hypothetical protein
MNQQHSEVRIATLGDPGKSLLIAAGAVDRRETAQAGYGENVCCSGYQNAQVIWALLARDEPYRRAA